MINRKLFGTNSLIKAFTERLTKVSSPSSIWSTEYIDSETGQQWIKYVVDDHGFLENMMIISPKPSTDELVEIAFTSLYPDEVAAAAMRLSIEEKIEKKEYRELLIERIKKLEIPQLDKAERERLRTIIQYSQLTDRVNKRNIIGKQFSDIQNDATFFETVATKAQEVLDKL